MKIFDFKNNKDITIIFFLALITFLSRIYYRSYGYDIYDVTAFKYGIDNLAPIHPPGYPVLLITGRLLNYFTGDSLDSLIYISIISSVVLIVCTFLIAKILSNDNLVALVSATIIMVNPTVWVFGIIGMSDMFQAAGVSLIVLFCAAALRYNKSKFLYVALGIFGLTLGIKLNHVLLTPLLIYTYFNVKEKISISKSVFYFIIPTLSWAIPFYLLMPQTPLSSSEILARDFEMFNVFHYGAVNKILELINFSAFVHYKYSVPLLLIFIFIILVYVGNYLIQNSNFFKLRSNFSILLIKNLFLSYDPRVFIFLWTIPYLAFNYVVLASRLRYFLPIYPAIVLTEVFILIKISKLYSQKSLYEKVLNKYIINSFIILFIAFSIFVSIDTVSKYHENLDTRSQIILFYKDIGLKNAWNGTESSVFINGIWGGRMDFYWYNLIYNNSLYTDSLEIIDYQPLKYPFLNKDIEKVENELFAQMYDRKIKNREVYLIGDLIELSDLDNIAFELKKIKTFYRPHEWIIDDPKGYITLYQFEPLGEPLWRKVDKKEAIESKSESKTNNIKVGRLEDDNIYSYLSSHAPVNGIRFENFSIENPRNNSITLDFFYGFVTGADKTNGVNFSISIDGKNILSDNKLYTGSLSKFSYDLSKLNEKNVTVSLGVDSNGNNESDWAVWIPTLIKS